MFKTIKIIYLTLIHASLAVAIFLYTSNTYTLAKMEPEQHTEQAQCCGTGDELTALLDSHSHRHAR